MDDPNVKPQWVEARAASKAARDEINKALSKLDSQHPASVILRSVLEKLRNLDEMIK